MFRLSQSALVTLVACVFGCWQIESLAQEEIPWRTDSDSAISEAANADKFVLYHFFADWCRPCNQLDTFVFRNPAVIRAIDHNVVPVKVDVDLHPELVKQYGITGIPADVIITPSGRIVKQRTSPKEADGYAKMLNQLARVDRELKAGNKALAQKIDEVLALAKPDSSKVLDHDGFAAKAPSHEQAAPSGESAEMARKYANNFDMTTGKLATSENDFQPTVVDMTKPTGAASQLMQTNFTNAPPSAVTLAEPSGANQKNTQAAPTRIVNERFWSDNNVARTALTQPAAKHSLFALHGKCPVSLIQKGKWVDGDPQYGCVHRGKLYVFADEAKLLTFQRDPDDYSPMLAGYDPVIYFERGELVDGHEKHGVFMGKLPNQSVILFSSSESRAKFQQDPRRYLSVVQQAVKETDDIKTR